MKLHGLTSSMNSDAKKERKRQYRKALVQCNMYISFNTTFLKTGAAGFSQTATDSETVPANARQKQINSFRLPFHCRWLAVHYFKVKESSNNC